MYGLGGPNKALTVFLPESLAAEDGGSGTTTGRVKVQIVSTNWHQQSNNIIWEMIYLDTFSKLLQDTVFSTKFGMLKAIL